MRNGKNTATQITISKGYRLKPSTHNLIKLAQKLLNSTQEIIISSAIKLFHKEIMITKKLTINKIIKKNRKRNILK